MLQVHMPINPQFPDLVLIQIEFNGLQFLYCIWHTLDLVFGEIHHIQMTKTAQLGGHSPKLISRKAQGLESWELSKASWQLSQLIAIQVQRV